MNTLHSRSGDVDVSRSRAADGVALVLSLAVLGLGSAVAGPLTMPGERPAAAATWAGSAASSSDSAPRSSSAPGWPTNSGDTVQVTLRVGDQVVRATLADTPAGHEFAAMLPVTMDLQDPFGQVSPLFLLLAAVNQALWLTWALLIPDAGTAITAAVTGAGAAVNLSWWLARLAGLPPLFSRAQPRPAEVGRPQLTATGAHPPLPAAAGPADPRSPCRPIGRSGPLVRVHITPATTHLTSP